MPHDVLSGTGLGDADRDPVTIRLGFHALAGHLRGLRRAWKRGDQRMAGLLDAGFKHSSGGFARIMSSERLDVRVERDKILREIVPFVLPHTEDSNLDGRLLTLLDQLDVDEYFDDVHGVHRARWRQEWEETGLDRELENVCRLLEAAGDRVLLQHPAKEAPSSTTWLVGALETLSKLHARKDVLTEAALAETLRIPESRRRAFKQFLKNRRPRHPHECGKLERRVPRGPTYQYKLGERSFFDAVGAWLRDRCQ